MKLSVIIPMYNVENYIDQCINSLLDQNISKEDYEIIIINDGSTDNSYKTAKKYSEENISIQLFSQKNQGVSIARNNGLKYAKGKYIYFVDADDYIIPNTLSQLIKLSNDSNLDILEFQMKMTKSRNLESFNKESFSLNNFKILSGKEYVSNRYFHDSNCVYFYNREFILNSKVKFIEGRTKQDLMFNAEIIPLANRISYIPYDVYRYVINPNSLWTSRESKVYRKSIDDFIYMTIRYSKLILKLEKQKIDTNILKAKKQIMLFNIFKRLLKCDFKISEINQIIKILSNHNLYPLNIYLGKNFYRKLLTLVFNNRIVFVIAIWFYRIFQIPIENIIVQNYQNKKRG